MTARRPSPVPALRAVAQRAVTVSDVVTAPIWTIGPDDDAREAAAALAARDFDVAAVADSRIHRYVRREDLAATGGAAGDVARVIDATEIVSATLPIADLVDRLASRERVFVLDNDGIRWLVTRADLQAPAVGMVALAYLIAFEAAISELVRDHLGDGFLELLPEERRRRAEQLFEHKQQDNTEISLADCLMFADWLKLARKSAGVRAALDCPSCAEFDRLVSRFDVARNGLAHGGTLLDGCTSEEAVGLFARIRRAAETAWSAVDALDTRWDAYAASVITGDDGTIWAGPGAGAVTGTWHVITAANPDSAVRPADVNATANRQLHAVLAGRGLAPIPVVGSSRDGSWREASFAVRGLERADACVLGDRFGQAAVFELDAEELRVLRCPDGRTMRSRPRLA